MVCQLLTSLIPFNLCNSKVGSLFFLSLFFNPIFASVPPWATGPALIIVGSLMMESVTKIKWHDMRQSVPAFVSMVIMPFTYSIAYGIIGGLITHFMIRLSDFVLDFLYSKCGCCQRMECCKPTDDSEDAVSPRHVSVSSGSEMRKDHHPDRTPDSAQKLTADRTPDSPY